MSVAERIVTAIREEETLLRENEPKLPEWMMLQQEIRNRLIQLRKLTELGVTGGLDESLDEVNRKVAAYNALVPTPHLRRAELTRQTFMDQLDHWKTM